MAGSDGNVWFTENNTTNIGRMLPDGSMTEFPISGTFNQPNFIIKGPNGNPWFTVSDSGGNTELGTITYSGTVTTYPLSPNSTGIGELAAGPDGNVWFTDDVNSKVGKITPSGTVTEYATPTPSSQPERVTLGSDGNMWFIEETAGKLVRITPTGTTTEFTIPNAIANIGKMVLGSDNNLWFSKLGTLYQVTSSGVFTQFSIPSAPTVDPILAAGPGSGIWFSSAEKKTVGNVASGVVHEYSTGSTTPGVMTAGPDGNMWFAGTFEIGRVTPSGTITMFSGSTLQPSAIITGADNNIYFTDATANKVGRLDLLPSITNTKIRQTTYGSRIILTGDNYTNTTNVTLNGSPISQSPCPTTPTEPCYTILTDTNILIETTTVLSSSSLVKVTNSWGQGTPTSVPALATEITSQGTFTPHLIEPTIRYPYSLAKGSDGNIWFTEVNPDAIARMTPDGQVTDFPLPTSPNGLSNLTAGTDNNLWFTESTSNQIGRITPSGTITEFAIPTSSSGASDITAGPDGNVWFAESSANKIGRVTPSGVITEFAVTGSPNCVANGSDGTIWYCLQNGGVGHMTTSGVATNISLPSGASPQAMTAGPDGNMWVTDAGNDQVDRITPGGTITPFSGLSAGSYAFGIAKGSDGNLWVADDGVNKIAKVTTAGAITEYAYSGPDDYGLYMISDGDNLWFTTSDSVDELALPATPTPPSGGGGGSGGGQGTGGSSSSSSGTTAASKPIATTNNPTTPTPQSTAESPTTTAPASPINLNQFPDFTNGQGYTMDVNSGDQYVFTPTDSAQVYTLTVAPITPDKATITATPPGKSDDLLPNRTKSLDVTGDNKPDITLIATKLQQGRARITFALYHTPDQAGAAAPTAQQTTITQLPLVIVGLPYGLLAIMGLIMLVLLRTVWREFVALRRLRAFYQLQTSVASQKKVFIELAAHYLRTPLTIVAASADNLRDGKLKAIVNDLGRQIELLLGGNETRTAAITMPPTKHVSFGSVMRSPAFFVPVILLAATIGVIYWIVAANGNGQLAYLNLFVEIALFVLLSLGLYALLRNLRLYTNEQEELNSALFNQARLDAQRNAFIGDAANTLQGKINAISQYVTSAPQANTTAMQDGLARLQTLVGRFALAKELQLATQPTTSQELELSTLWRQAGNVVTQAKSRGVAVSFPTTDEALHVRSAGPLAIVTNAVIDNAVAYSPSGSSVEVSLAPKAHGTTITVTDHGKGMPPQDAAQWFKPFTKSEGAITFDHEGVGLSLYLSRLIMTYLGGDITLQSAVGQGTKVSITVPDGV